MANRKKAIIKGTLILTAASVITRVLGFIYRIYMVDSIGAEGMGLYQLIMPVYNLAWSISCSGFTTTISRVTAQENAKKQYGNMGRVLKQCLLITGGISLALCAMMFFGAGFIGERIIGDGRTVLSLKILSAAIPFMAAGSCIRGYFLGLQKQTVPAVSQVLEQSVRMGVIYALAAFMVPMGLEYACAAAVIGVFFGESISCLFMLASYRSFKTKNAYTARPTLSPAQTVSMIMVMALPLTLNRVTGSLLSAVEDILIPQRLRLFGMTAQEAISAFGQITGMAMPLIFFPSALLTALAISLVPSVSEDLAVKNTKGLEKTAAQSIRFTALMAMAASIIFLVFPDELGMLVYKQDIGSMLFLLGVMSPFWYIGPTLGGLLNGLGEQIFIFRNSLLSSFINIFIVYFFVPRYGVNAFIIGWMISLILVTWLDLSKVRECTGIRTRYGQWFVKPVLAAAAAALITEYVYNHVISPHVSALPGLIVGLALMEGLYLAFIMLLGCLKKEDVAGIINLKSS